MNRLLADELNRLMATETRSLAAHLIEAKPWLTPQTYRLWLSLRHIGHESDEHARAISQLLASHNMKERASSFKSDVANYHYCDLPHLLPLLIQEKQSQLRHYERVLGLAQDEPEAARLLQRLRDETAVHLAQLESAGQALPLATAS